MVLAEYCGVWKAAQRRGYFLSDEVIYGTAAIFGIVGVLGIMPLLDENSRNA